MARKRLPCRICGGSKDGSPHRLWCARCVKKKATRKRGSDKAWERRIEETYGITPDEYQAILDTQNGVCFICQRANGSTRRLSVDHDHALEKLAGSRASVRGLLCRPCNRMLGHMRDDPHAFLRAIEYLNFPPACQVLGTEPNPNVTAKTSQILPPF